MIIKIESRNLKDNDTFKQDTKLLEAFFAKYNLLPQKHDTLMSDQDDLFVVSRREFSPENGGKVFIIVDTPL
tara:strand:- start:441 stop:656 length:216 start_codon:yes stop_codon:yes gene_type:complete